MRLSPCQRCSGSLLVYRDYWEQLHHTALGAFQQATLRRRISYPQFPLGKAFRLQELAEIPAVQLGLDVLYFT
jgi:hypothetical protein